MHTAARELLKAARAGCGEADFLAFLAPALAPLFAGKQGLAALLNGDLRPPISDKENEAPR